MVDAIVSYAVGKVGDFLIHKVVLRLKIREDVEWLRNELRYMQSFLKDAEAKQSKDHLVQQWVSEITDLAYDTVDILQNIILKSGSDEASNYGVFDRLKRYVCICKNEADVFGITSEIDSLKTRVLDLSRKRETYGIRTVDPREGSSSSDPNNRSIMRSLRRTTSYAEEETFIGFEDVTKMLLKELLKGDDRRRVISIYGMGGLGKTSLARKLYNSVDVQNRFGCRAWVCVSQEYNTQELLRTVIKSFKRGCTKEELEMIEKMNEGDLERYLREFLKNQRYLVVVDDVWRKEAWESLKRAFPDCQNGSRVIITTRIKDVAERVDERSFVHHLRFLSLQESWDLFRKKIARGDGHAHWFSPAMQEMGNEMVGKCGGLPLAIVVLGGLLSTKKEPEEWHKVKEQLWQHMKQDSIDIFHILTLSYNDLSGELKQCLLYLGIFPEDYVISVEKLMRLWMAEEFIPQGNKMEDIAEDYLHQLINRSLIQVAGRYWGRIEACRIHDLLRDLVVDKARKTNFFDIYDPRIYTSIVPSSRRQAIHTQVRKFFSDSLSGVKFRSLVIFNPDYERPNVANLTTICVIFKYLCVLDLVNIEFNDQRLPDSIGDLIQLKFLGLIGTNFQILPPTIGNLKSLQTLEISVSQSTCNLPMEISKLVNLRHLYIHRHKGPLQIDCLTNLRTLKGIDYEQWIDLDTSNLINLQELVLVNLDPAKVAAYTLDSVTNLKRLATLVLDSRFYHLPPLEPLLSCPNLHRLWLTGVIPKLPPFIELPQSLTMLRLVNSRLKEDPMPTLEKLLNLSRLELEYTYDGETITCTNNGFHQLEYLRLSRLINLENWRLAERAMPVIRSLSIYHCPKLELPERLKSVPVIAELEDNNTILPYRRSYHFS